MEILGLYPHEDTDHLRGLVKKQVLGYGKLIMELENLAGRLRYDKLPIKEDANGGRYYYISDKEGHSLLISHDSTRIYTPNLTKNSSNSNRIEIDGTDYKPFTVEDPDYMGEYMMIAELCLGRVNEHRDHGFIAEAQGRQARHNRQ